MKTSILTTIILLLTLISCNKDVEVNSILFSTWEAKSFMSIESVAYPKNENNKIQLAFYENGIYSLKLDVNGCGGTFKMNNENQIEIEPANCTYICCDSKFSDKLAMTISKVTSYSIEGKILKLNVPQWGYIKLELVE